MNSPARRVLGDKDKNAHLRLRSPDRSTSALKHSMAAPSSPRVPPPVTRLSPSPKAGSKRKIGDVEDAERVDPEDNHDSQRTQLLSDSEPEDEPTTEASISNAQTSYDTAETSFSASQNPLEPQFELPQEEMSQRTLEKLNEVPMPRNNSQLPPHRPGLLKEISAGSVGLSSFINFEGPPSSQASDAMQPIELPEPRAADEERQSDTQDEQPLSEADARKKMLNEKAAEMRTRLQLALFKVQTKQTNQPFSRLKVPKPTRERSNSPPTQWMPSLTTPRLSSSTIQAPSSTRTVTSIQQQTHSAEESIASMRAQATNQLKPPVRSLNDLPMPRLDPELADIPAGKSFDSSKTQQIIVDEDQDTQQFPSSPPLSRQPSLASNECLLPGVNALVTGQPETQLSSPPASDADANEESGLTKMVSVSKGEAASGLVQLMTGATGM